jgi:ketosteroid isomerase-like protein
MSANLDLVRSIYADWERGDWSSAAWADPDIEHVMVDEPGARTVTGRVAMADAWRAFLSSWTEYRVEPVEYRELDDERIFVLVRARGRGASSGLDLGEATRGTSGANLFHIREGTVIRLAAYIDYDRALADLGLDEEAVSQENAEVVRDLWSVWERDGIGVVPGLMDPEIEYVNPPYAVEPGTRRGYDEFAAAARALNEVYGGHKITDARLREIGRRVVVTATVATESRENAVPIEAQRGYVFDVRDGRVTRFAWFNDPAEALKAVGLEE